jgi:hypothetical protein
MTRDIAPSLDGLMTGADSLLDCFEERSPEWMAVVDLASEVKRLRVVEAAARDVLDAYDARDDEQDWSAPMIETVLRRALTEGHHYDT